MRFAARFGLDDRAGHGRRDSRVTRDQLKRISPERVADELRLMLVPPTRAAAWEMLWGFGLLPVIFRTSAGATSRPNRPIDTPDRFSGTCAGEPVPFRLALAASVLCYRAAGAGSPSRCSSSCRRSAKAVHACGPTLKISNDESDFMTGVLHLGPLLRDGTPTVATMKRFLATPIARWARVLLDAMNRTARFDSN